MGNREPLPKTGNYALFISLVSLLTFVVLFSLRALDDNRLTSWQWVFPVSDPLAIYLLLVAGHLACFFLLKVKLPDSYNGIFLFLVSFVIAGVFWSEPEVILDTARYFTQAKYLELYGVHYFLSEWGKSINAWTDLPLISFFYGLIFRYFGEVRLYVQLFTTTLFSLAVVLVYLTGRELWDEDTGFYGGLLLLGMPYLFTQVPLMLVDVPAMFFLMLAVFATITALRKGGIWLFYSSVAIFLAVLSKYSAWLMLSILAMIVLTALFRDEKVLSRTIILRTASIATGLLVLTGLVYWYKADVFIGQIKLLVDYQKPGLSRWGESFLSTFFFQIHPFISIAAVFSVYAGLKKKDLRYLIIVWLVALVIVMQIRRIRYIIMVFPMLALMASYGLSEIRRRDVRKFVVFCALLTSLVIAVFAYLPFMKKLSAVNLKHAGEFLDTMKESHVKVVTVLPEEPAGELSVTVPILDLFTRKKISYLPGKETEAELTEEQKKAPLRFTWEYRTPEYYIDSSSHSEEAAVVVISGTSEDVLPEGMHHLTEGYSLSKQFSTDEDIFIYKTILRVYRRQHSTDVR